MKSTSPLRFTILVLLALGPGSLVISQPIPTNEWVNFYSTNTTLDSLPVPVGVVINAFDPDSVWCGTFTVHTAGEYGFLLVYRDDSTTPEVDEGADPGDTITVYINGHLAIPLGPDAPVWTANGDIIELNLEGHSGQTGLSPGVRPLSETYVLSQNYPNPFNPVTKISYQLPESGHVKLTVFNFLGQSVRTLVDAQLEAGYYSEYWDGTNDNGKQVTSGIYFYRMKVANFMKTKKMIFLR